MMKTQNTLFTLAVVATLGLTAPLRAAAEPETAPAAPNQPAEEIDKPLQFEGKVKEVELKDKTIKLELTPENTVDLVVTKDTKFSKEGKEVRFEDLKAGDEIHGLYLKADGKNEALLVLYGPRRPIESVPRLEPYSARGPHPHPGGWE